MAAQSFQDRMIQSITAKIEAAGFEVSTQADWGNTGSIYAHREGVIVPVITVGYNFQSGSYTLTLTAGDRRVPSQIGREGYFDFYHPTVTAKTLFDECLALELKAAQRRHAMTDTSVVWVLSLHDRKNNYLMAFRNEASANEYMVAYCRDQWLNKRMMDGVPPADDEEMMTAFFDQNADEGYEIDKCDLDPSYPV
jgi:hypothetical protein